MVSTRGNSLPAIKKKLVPSVPLKIFSFPTTHQPNFVSRCCLYGWPDGRKITVNPSDLPHMVGPVLFLYSQAWNLITSEIHSRTWWDPLFSLLSEPGTLSLPRSTRSPLFFLYLFSLSERGRRRRAQSGSDPPPAERRRPFLHELAAGAGRRGEVVRS